MPFQMDDGVQGFLAHRFRKQVQQPVFGDVAAAVEMQGQPFVEVGVVSAHFFDILRPELRGRGKDVRVRVESRAGAVGFLRGSVLPSLGDFLSAAELVGTRFPVAIGLDFKEVGQGVDRLDAHSIEAYGFLKASLSYLAPVLIFAAQSSSLPSGMPRPKSRTSHRPSGVTSMVIFCRTPSRIRRLSCR